MFGERRIRALVGPADPTHGLVIPCALVPAADVIARAEALVDHAPMAQARIARTFQPTRRWLLASAGASAAAVAAGTVVARTWGTSTDKGTQQATPPSTRGSGTVVVPVAYQIPTNPPPAGDHLRTLASTLIDAQYDRRTGRYAYHHIKSWGQPRVMSPEGFVMSRAQEIESWSTSGGQGFTKTTDLDPEFPTPEARDYWTRVLSGNGASASPQTIRGTPALPQFASPAQVGPDVPLASDPARLSTLLSVDLGAAAVARKINDQYRAYVIPTGTRAQIFEVLANVEGFGWRGEAIDRAGRPGVAITVDDIERDQQTMLIFDQRTGSLLAWENIQLQPHQVTTYTLFLGYDNTDTTH